MYTIPIILMYYTLSIVNLPSKFQPDKSFIYYVKEKSFPCP